MIVIPDLPAARSANRLLAHASPTSARFVMEAGEAFTIHQATVAMPSAGIPPNVVSVGRRAAAPGRHRPLSGRDLEGGTREQPGGVQDRQR
jgi:hypothetical protein